MPRWDADASKRAVTANSKVMSVDESTHEVTHLLVGDMQVFVQAKAGGTILPTSPAPKPAQTAEYTFAADGFCAWLDVFPVDRNVSSGDTVQVIYDVNSGLYSYELIPDTNRVGSAVVNDSTVAGASVSDALNALGGAIDNEAGVALASKADHGYEEGETVKSLKEVEEEISQLGQKVRIINSSLNIDLVKEGYLLGKRITSGGYLIDDPDAMISKLIPISVGDNIKIICPSVTNYGLGFYDTNKQLVGFYGMQPNRTRVMSESSFAYISESINIDNISEFNLEVNGNRVLPDFNIKEKSANTYQWRQGYTQGGQNMEYFVSSNTEISTFGIPVGLVRRIYVETGYILNVFQYDANGSYLSYTPITGDSSFVIFSPVNDKVTFVRFSLRASNGSNVSVSDGVNIVKNKTIWEELTKNENTLLNASVDAPIFRQGTVRAGVAYYADDIWVDSAISIHTQALLYNDIEKIIYDSTTYEVWAFYFRVDYSSISYAQLPSSGILPTINDCEYVVFAVNAKGNPITSEGFDMFTQFVIHRKLFSTTHDIDNKVYGEKTWRQTYSGDRITLFDDNSQYYSRKQFAMIPFEGTHCQSFAIYGQYAIFLFHESMTGSIYRLSDNKKVCDITFPTDSTYGNSHNNACGFGADKYDADDDFPVFCISQFNLGTGSYLVYRLINSNGIYTAELIQIITASSSLKADADFGLGYGDWVIDRDNSHLYHLGFSESGTGGTIKLTKFELPTLTDGDGYASSTGGTIKVVTLNSTDILDYYNIGSTYTLGLQDNCYYNGHIIISGWSYWAFVNLSTKNISLIPSNVGIGYGEAEGVDIYRGEMAVSYWGQPGLFSVGF